MSAPSPQPPARQPAGPTRQPAVPPARRSHPPARRPASPPVPPAVPAAAAEGHLRIGDMARLAGTTPRTIRYYEEVGLLPETVSRPSGRHRLYTQAEVDRLRDVMRLKELLGLTLEELKTVLAAEEARAEVRAQLERDDVSPGRRRELLAEALGHLDRQLELVRHRAAELAKLQDELSDKRRRVRRRIRELEAETAAPASR